MPWPGSSTIDAGIKWTAALANVNIRDRISYVQDVQRFGYGSKDMATNGGGTSDYTIMDYTGTAAFFRKRQALSAVVVRYSATLYLDPSPGLGPGKVSFGITFNHNDDSGLRIWHPLRSAWLGFVSKHYTVRGVGTILGLRPGDYYGVLGITSNTLVTLPVWDLNDGGTVELAESDLS
jgi:hypothetical protein